MQFIYLNEDEMIEAGVMDMRQCMETMKDMFKLLKIGDYRMGGENGNSHGVRIKFPPYPEFDGMPASAPDRWFTSMPAYLGGRFKMVGVKTYGSNHDNVKKTLPRSVLMLSLLDKETGVPLAYMSANILSAMRTGAVAGLGAEYLAPKETRKLAIIGPGTMSRYATDSIVIACPKIHQIKIKGRSQENILRFIEYSKKRHPQIKQYSICDTVEEACKDSDIIFTGNTRAEVFEDNPLLDETCLKKNALIITSSAFRMYNDFLSDNSLCVCVADNDKMYQEDFGVDALPIKLEERKSTTFNVFLHEMESKGSVPMNLGDIITNPFYQRNEEKIYVYGAYGMPIEDVAWGYECYQNALKNSIGTKLKLWDSPKL